MLHEAINSRIRLNMPDEPDKEYKFIAMEETELPRSITLTVQLQIREMLPEVEKEAEEEVKAILGFTCEDSGWPSKEWQLSSVNWMPFKDQETDKPVASGRGYWLIRFRVSPDIAEFIKTEQNGEIQMLTETVAVYHAGDPWRGDNEPTYNVEFGPLGEDSAK